MYDLTHDIVINDRFRVKHLLDCEVRKRAGQLADTATLHLSGMAYNHHQKGVGTRRHEGGKDHDQRRKNNRLCGLLK